ncbi:FecR family protein [Sphingobacterium alkalisoli]|uniref:FecR family protein n=1 Tax=Sphingobacterium alkalisoli TaxID=1874115 RepID=A0A4V5LYM4_9SPHI|nr:FecR family protein [Sphingobacterium alkalisoli]TJY67069.1 FecR family protein [Sphingobacterium alkalisoli]GGH12430.1 anti-sigma factor [Sphingobacterium alkalisoli]
MKAPKRKSLATKEKEHIFSEVTPLDSESESLLEKRLYERVLQSYSTHREKKERRSIMWKHAAIWIGVLLLAGGVIWGNVLLRSTDTKETAPVQLFSSTNNAKRINLPDSTVVILRPYSRLQVAAGYNRSERNVVLEGNAFFEVRKNAAKPFVVHSKHLETTVLGTRFSVSSPVEGDQHSVFLEEGKVSIRIDQREVELTPNERMVYQESTQKWEVTKSSDVSLNMQNGSLTLNGVDFATLRQCLADYYNISLIHLTDKATQVRYKVTLTPHMDLKDIASLISTISARRTIIKDQTITIK